MLTGDRPEPAQEIGTVLGLDEVRAEQTPASKLAAVRAEGETAVTIMVGDGINDAPALAAATVGVAMGARGATASSEAADIVLTTDRLERLADAMEIARRARHIAVQSAVAGMAMSLLAMIAAALGYLPPAGGALLQEGIDVAVILNALRALTGGRRDGVTVTAETDVLLQGFAVEHVELRDALASLRSAAGLLSAGVSPEALAAVRMRTFDPGRADTPARTGRGDAALSRPRCAARQPGGDGADESRPRRDRATHPPAGHAPCPDRCRRRASTRRGSMTCSPACMACTRCSHCTSPKKRKATSPSPIATHSRT